MIRDADILAAGRGTRLRVSNGDLPKPLHEVGGVALIKRTILTLASAGVTRVVIVTGFMAEQVSAAVMADPAYAAAGVRIDLVHNPELDKVLDLDDATNERPRTIASSASLACDGGRVRVHDIGDEWWQDVDTPEDLARAKTSLAIVALRDASRGPQVNSVRNTSQ